MIPFIIPVMVVAIVVVVAYMHSELNTRLRQDDFDEWARDLNRIRDDFEQRRIDEATCRHRTDLRDRAYDLYRTRSLSTEGRRIAARLDQLSRHHSPSCGS